MDETLMFETSIREFASALREDGLSAGARYATESLDKFLVYPFMHRLFYSHLKGYAVTGIKHSPVKFIVNASDGGKRGNLFRYGIGTELLRYHTHETLSTEIFNMFLKPRMRCVDAGANIGYYALQEAYRIGGEGRVYAIEPVPANYRLLNANVRLNGFRNIETYNLAVSNYTGNVSMYLSPASNWGSCVQTPLNDGVEMQVPCVELDEFLEDKGKVDVLRMDVEGYESTILDGATYTLTHNKLLLFIEVHSLWTRENVERTTEMLEELAYFGYRPIALVTGNHNGKLEKLKSIKEILRNKRLMSMIWHGFFTNSG